MKSKLILLLAILIFAALTILLSMLIEKSKSPAENLPEKTTSEILNENFSGNVKSNKPSGAMESMQWISQIRAYPETDVPADKYYNAFEYSKQNLQSINERDDAGQWKSLGPNNIGGRSLCLAIHPADTGTVFIGAASGGLWKSTSGGTGANAWTLINTGFPSSAVSSIAIDSANPNIMYIGTGENYGYQLSENGLDIRVTRGMYGIGILKTTDGGTTWSKSLDWSYDNKRGVWSVIINPKNSNIIYAGTSEGIFKSNNSGNNWNQILNYQMVMDLEINPIDTSILYASIGNLTNNVQQTDKGIFKTTNSGNNWTKLSGGLPANWSGKATIELYKGNPNIIYASIPNDFSYVGYYKSVNSGNTWTSVNSTVPTGNQGWYNNGHIIKSDNPNIILVGTLNVEKSIDGGSSFNTMSSWSEWIEGATPPGEPEGPDNFVHADVHFFITNPKDPNKVYIASDGGLYRSNDFGETYFSCNGGFVTSQFYATFANSYQDSIFAIGGLQDNRAALYQGSNAWYKTFYGDGMSCAVNSFDDNICYTEYTYGAINKSTNRGIDWIGISPPGAGNSSNYCFVTPFISCISNPDVMFTGGKSIYKSASGGGNWQGPYGTAVFNGTKILSIASSHTGTDTVYCGAVNGRIFKSVNAGLTWTNITDSNVTPNRYATDITINPNNAAEIFVTFGGYGTGHVFKTIDAGNSWQNISGNLPDVPHQSIVVDPDYIHNVYVGSDLGVYVTTNAGVSWNEYRNGMPYALTFDLSIVYPNKSIRATTYGNGVYERKLYQNPVSVNQVNTNQVNNFKLYQNYPNPFNPETKLEFGISKLGFVSLIIYDVNGKEVATIVNSSLNPGTYKYSFNGSDLSSGIYFYTLKTDGFSETKRMVLVK